jgi:acetyl-CoA synthetase (ADP-forming)
VRGEAELILGARYDETFGAQVLAGFGGIMVEVLRDIQVASAPLGPEQAHAMLRRLSIWPILAGCAGARRSMSTRRPMR